MLPTCTDDERQGGEVLAIRQLPQGDQTGSQKANGSTVKARPSTNPSVIPVFLKHNRNIWAEGTE